MEEVRSIANKDQSARESQRSFLLQLLLRLQELAAAIKQIFEGATDEIKLDFHELEQNDVPYFELKPEKQKVNPLKRPRKTREEKEKDLNKEKKKRKIEK